MSGMLLVRLVWFVGALLWGAIFTFVDISVHRSPLAADSPSWLLWSYEHAAVLLSAILWFVLQLWNWRVDAVLGTPFAAFKTSFWSRVVFCGALVLALGLGSAVVRQAVGQPAFPPISLDWLFLPFAAVALAYVTAPRQVQFEKANG